MVQVMPNPVPVLAHRTKLWLSSAWILSLTPEAKTTKLEKQLCMVTCPMSGKPLSMSDLMPVQFVPLVDSVDLVGLILRSEHYVCTMT